MAGGVILRDGPVALLRMRKRIQLPAFAEMMRKKKVMTKEDAGNDEVRYRQNTSPPPSAIQIKCN